MSCYYTISDMISMKVGENYLSESVLECIENLNNSIVDTTSKPSKYDRRKNNDYRVKHQRPFKSTVIKKTETDLDVHIHNIRISMNKVSVNNMVQHRDVIMKSLEDLKSMNQEMKPIYFNILNTASSNRFGYKLYIEIMCMMVVFACIVESKFDRKMHSLERDEFCSIWCEAPMVPAARVAPAAACGALAPCPSWVSW